MNFLQKQKLNSLRTKIQKLHDLREQGSNLDVAVEIAAYFELAKFYENHQFDKDVPRAEIYVFESYRAAAALGSAQAQYICGQRLFEKAQFWESLSQTNFGQSIHKKYAEDTYAEAFTYLIEAENQGHAIAKRLHGLAYVKGLGLPKDMDKGFLLIVESIDQEKAWDKVTKIFVDLGLNSPEFFSMLVTHRNRKNSN